MEGNDHDNRPRSDRQYREGLMTGLLIALANQVGRGWSTVIIAVLVLLGLSLRRGRRLVSGTAGIFYGFRPLVFNQGTISRQKNQAAFLRPRRFMVPAVALATSKITVLLSG